MARPKKRAVQMQTPVSVAQGVSDIPEIGSTRRVDTQISMPIGESSAGVNTFNRGMESGLEASQPAIKAAGMVAEAREIDAGKAALAEERRKAQAYQKLLMGGVTSLQAYVDEVKKVKPEFGERFQQQLNALMPAFQDQNLTREDYTTLTNGQFEAWDKTIQETETGKLALAEVKHGYTMKEIEARGKNALSLAELQGKNRQRLLYYAYKTKSGDWALVADKANTALEEVRSDLADTEAALQTEPYNKVLLGSKSYLQGLVKFYEGFAFKAQAAGAPAPDKKKSKFKVISKE